MTARLNEIREAAEHGTPAVAVLLAGWEAAAPASREPRLSKPAAAQLARSAGQLDRLQGPGTTTNLLLDALLDAALTAAEVHSAAYFVRLVKLQARTARRYDRHSRGKLESPRPRPWRSRTGEDEWI